MPLDLVGAIVDLVPTSFITAAPPKPLTTRICGLDPRLSDFTIATIAVAALRAVIANGGEKLIRNSFQVTGMFPLNPKIVLGTSAAEDAALPPRDENQAKAADALDDIRSILNDVSKTPTERLDSLTIRAVRTTTGGMALTRDTEAHEIRRRRARKMAGKGRKAARRLERLTRDTGLMSMQQLIDRAKQRENEAAALTLQLTAALDAAKARQTACDSKLKTIGDEAAKLRKQRVVAKGDAKRRLQAKETQLRDRKAAAAAACKAAKASVKEATRVLKDHTSGRSKGAKAPAAAAAEEEEGDGDESDDGDESGEDDEIAGAGDDGVEQASDDSDAEERDEQVGDDEPDDADDVDDEPLVMASDDDEYVQPADGRGASKRKRASASTVSIRARQRQRC